MRWEYRNVSVPHERLDSKLTFLNDAGAYGWELTGYVYDTGTTIDFLMKRSIPESPARSTGAVPEGPRCICAEPQFFLEAKPVDAWWRCLRCKNFLWMGNGPEPM